MLPTLRLAIVVLGMVGMIIVGMASTITGMQMVQAVNAKLPANERFAEFGWYLGKTQRLFREYRRLYPAGTLFRRQMRLQFGVLGCMVIAAAATGFGVPMVLMGVGLGGFWWLLFVRGTEPS
jgi:hypothetical protein